MLPVRRPACLLRLSLTTALILSIIIPVLPAAAQAPALPADDPSSVASAPAPAAAPSAAPCGPAFSGVELPSLRTRTSRTYLAGGTHHLVACAEAVNYLDASGAWQPVDNTLHPTTVSGYASQNAANTYQLLLPSSLSAAPVKVSSGASSVAFQLVGASGTLATTTNTATYANALPGVDVAYIARGDSVQENLTLQSASAPASFAFTLSLSPNLSARTNSSGGIDFVDSSGQVQLSFPAPYAVDSSHQPVGITRAVSFSLSQAGAATTVTLSIDPTWLKDPARVYPVVVDPHVQWHPSQTCYLASGSQANTSFCGANPILVGYDGTSIYRSITQFDLSAVPVSSNVMNAEVALVLSSSSGTSSPKVQMMQVTQSWTTLATWNTRDGTNAWTNAGGTFNATPLDTETVNTPSGATTFFDFAGLAESWLNGTAANDGVLFQSVSESTATTYDFTNTQASFSPSLLLDYEPWMGEQPFWTYNTHVLTDRSHLHVNVANGNFMLDTTDLNVAGTGLPLNLARTYNSVSSGAEESVTSENGNRWVLSLGRTVMIDVNDESGVGYYGPDGYAVEFLFNANNTGYISPPGMDATLVENGDSTFDLTFHATGTTYHFNSLDSNGDGHLLSVKDKNGNTISLTYNGNGQVTSVTDTQGRVVTYAYNAQSLLSSITDWTNRQVSYGYTNGALTSFTDANSKTTSYGYDTNGNLNLITDPLGNQTKIVSDSSQRVTSITYVTNNSLGTGSTYSFTYNSGNTVVTDPNNHATTYYFDTSGRVTKVTDAQSNSFQTTWNGDNHVTQQTDAYSHSTTYTYSTDGNNNLLKVQLQTGAATQWAYTDANHPFYPTSFTDAQGNVISYAYDTNGNLHTITDQLSSQNQATINHNANGTISSVADFNGNTTSYGYDTKGNPTSMTPPSPLGAISLTPDSLSRPQSITQGTGNNLLVGDTTVEATVDSNTPGQAEAFQYTASSSGTAHQVDVYVDSSSLATQMNVGLYADNGSGSPGTLLAQGTLSSPLAGTWNAVNLPATSLTSGTRYWIAVLSPSGGGRLYYRDTASGSTDYSSQQTTLTALPATWTNETTFHNSPMSAYVVQGGVGTTSYTYDALDRTHVTTYPDNSTITDNYDADGNLTSLVDTTGTTSFVYDDLNRQVAKSLPAQTTPCTVTVNGTNSSGTICYGYDAASNLTSYSDAGAAIACNGATVTICYGYNSLDELTSLVDPANKTTTFGYDNNHHRTTTTYPGNTVVTTAYDSSQRITGVSAVNPSNVTLLSHTYSYANLSSGADTSLLTKITENDSERNVVTFDSYNALNNLTQWCVMPGGSSACNTTPPNYTHLYQYTFDGNSNRTQISADGAVSNLSYNAANEWTQTTTSSLGTSTNYWDVAGNLLGNNGFGNASQALTVSYNAKNQTATQTDINQYPEPMTFTGQGQWERVGKADSSGSHSYTYSLLGLTKVAGSAATYVRDPYGMLISQQGVSGGPFYYVLGADGSVDGLVDGNGNTSGQPAASYLYCPTGNEVATTGGSVATGNPFQEWGGFYDSETKSYWIGGQQIDSNSGNSFEERISAPAPMPAPPEFSCFAQVFGQFVPGPPSTLQVSGRNVCSTFLETVDMIFTIQKCMVSVLGTCLWWTSPVEIGSQTFTNVLPNR